MRTKTSTEKWRPFCYVATGVFIQLPENGPYPVMFYIHGGAYLSSGNIQYPGHFLAGRDVVMVAINYRLGPLGELRFVRWLVTDRCHVTNYILTGRTGGCH